MGPDQAHSWRVTIAVALPPAMITQPRTLPACPARMAQLEYTFLRSPKFASVGTSPGFKHGN